MLGNTNEYPLATLEQMKHKPAVSISTLSGALDGMFITLNLAEDVPEGRISQATPDRRV